MRRAALVVSVVIAGAWACSEPDDDAEERRERRDAAGDLTSPWGPAGDAGPAGLAGSGLHTGLPCGVQAIVENRCIACHGGFASPSLLNYADMVSPSASDPTRTNAQVALERMRSADRPMPPPPAVPADATEVRVFEEWVAAGTPRGTTCTDTPPRGGSSTGTPSCTSGTSWSLAEAPSPAMHPGVACNACHQRLGGPNLTVAGTVYPTLHEPDDCNGKGPPPSLTVVIQDASGQTLELPVNAAGNFFSANKITPPFRARVVDGASGAIRPMIGSVTSGDCNACHTAGGVNGAPGRVVSP